MSVTKPDVFFVLFFLKFETDCDTHPADVEGERI